MSSLMRSARFILAICLLAPVAFSLPARDHYERAHARARQVLGDAAYQVAAAGRALTLEQALAEAEAVLELDRDSGGDATS